MKLWSMCVSGGGSVHNSRITFSFYFESVITLHMIQIGHFSWFYHTLSSYIPLFVGCVGLAGAKYVISFVLGSPQKPENTL